jgi:hypothetical protein
MLFSLITRAYIQWDSISILPGLIVPLPFLARVVLGLAFPLLSRRRSHFTSGRRLLSRRNRRLPLFRSGHCPALDRWLLLGDCGRSLFSRLPLLRCEGDFASRSHLVPLRGLRNCPPFFGCHRLLAGSRHRCLAWRRLRFARLRQVALLLLLRSRRADPFVLVALIVGSLLIAVGLFLSGLARLPILLGPRRLFALPQLLRLSCLLPVAGLRVDPRRGVTGNHLVNSNRTKLTAGRLLNLSDRRTYVDIDSARAAAFERPILRANAIIDHRRSVDDGSIVYNDTGGPQVVAEMAALDEDK